jgi:cell wall-associated NlpC family hydrolase
MTRVAPGGGGEYTYRQMEQLWLSAGGRRSLAPTMAAIAEAESGGNPQAENPSGATGLWQILGAVRSRDQSRLTNPNVNAREAVLKYQDQGLSAWETYTSGAYKKFLQGRAPSAVVHGGRALLDEAEKFVGTPYVWGGESPKGFDCSGLVQYVAQKVGLKNVPRTSEAQWAYTQHISRSQLKPGDLVFYAGSDGTAASPGHVAIYAGNGQVIQAEQTGTDVGKFSLSAAGKPVGYGRLPGVGGADFTGSTGGGGTQATLTDIPLPGVPGVSQILGGALDTLGNLGGVGNVAHAIGALSNNLAKVEQGVLWLFVPSHWLRIVCFLLGVPLVGLGVVTMTKGSQPVPVSAYGVSTEISGGSLAPAVGIAEVTVGAVLLFVAFHNLDAHGVNDFGGLMSYLQNALQGQGAQPVDGG